jgi:hypothetical protein
MGKVHVRSFGKSTTVLQMSVVIPETIQNACFGRDDLDAIDVVDYPNHRLYSRNLLVTQLWHLLLINLVEPRSVISELVVYIHPETILVGS